MVFKALIIITVFAITVALFGCTVNQPAPSPFVEIQPEQETLIFEERETPIPEQMQVMESKQPDVAKYLPCIQGPETLRFLDRLFSVTFKGDTDTWEQFLEGLPPLTYQRLMERLEKCAATTDTTGAEVTCNDETQICVEAAEEFMKDCSDQLARLSAASTLLDSREVEAIVRLWQSNLEFMKWWLVNYHQKYGSDKNAH